MLRLVGDEGAAFGVFLDFVEPGSDVSKAARAERHNVLQRRRTEKVWLRHPLDNSTVGVEDGYAAVGGGIGLSFDVPGVDPTDGLAVTVFKEDGVVERWDSSSAPAGNPGNPRAETVEDRDVVLGLDRTWRRGGVGRDGKGIYDFRF